MGGMTSVCIYYVAIHKHGIDNYFDIFRKYPWISIAMLLAHVTSTAQIQATVCSFGKWQTDIDRYVLKCYFIIQTLAKVIIKVI